MRPDRNLLYSRNHHTIAGDQDHQEEEQEEEEEEEVVMMRTRVPSCSDLESETQFSVVEDGGVVVEGEEEALPSDLYCIDRSRLWYCSSALAR